MGNFSRKMKKVLSKPSLLLLYATKYSCFKLMPDKSYIKLKYRLTIGKRLNLTSPSTFNEKLQWLKLYDRNPNYTCMVDKAGVKDYVAQTIGPEYIIPTLGTWKKFDDIDFASLPDKFVLKCTHDSGGIVICDNKERLDISSAKKKIDKSLKRDYFYVHREWPYKNVPHRIIAEKYMENTDGSAMSDYKFFCFDGVPKIVLLCSERFSDGGLRENFYDTSWNMLDLKRPEHANTDYEVEKPKNLQLMLDLASKLSANIPFVRVDFYNIDGAVYFGEMTFFPAAGYEKFVPESWDKTLGDWINLNR